MVEVAKFGETARTALAIDFDWTNVSGGSISIGFCPKDGVIPEVVLIINSVFDGGLEITVGDIVAQGRLMVVADNKPGTAARYKNDTDYQYSIRTELFVFFPSGTPTTGNGRVIVYLE